MTRSPWHHEPRKALSEQQAAKLFVEHEGRCWRCQRKILAGDDWTVGHKKALECGGTNDWDNLAPECSFCKPKADAKDHAQAGKQRRSATKHFLPKSMRRKSALSKRQGTKYDWSRGRYVREE